MFTSTDINPSRPISVVNSFLLEIRKVKKVELSAFFFLMARLQFANFEYSPLSQHVAMVLGCL